MKVFLQVSCCAYKLFWLCYECNYMKGKNRKYVRDVGHMVQNTEKESPWTKISLRKWIQLKVYSHPVKNVWISSLTLILIFWWIERAVLRSQNFTKSLPNFYLWFLRYLENECVFYILPDLNRFLPQWKICFILTAGRDLIQWRIVYVKPP